MAKLLDAFDDVWDALSFYPREPRALGSVLREAGRRGWIARTDRVRPSERVVNHGRPVRIWRSRLRG